MDICYGGKSGSVCGLPRFYETGNNEIYRFKCYIPRKPFFVDYYLCIKIYPLTIAQDTPLHEIYSHCAILFQIK